MASKSTDKDATAEQRAAAFARWQKYQGMCDEQDRKPSGVWYVPDAAYEGWVFARCGVARGLPEAVNTARELYRHRIDMGWDPAPKGTRSSLYGNDGDDGLYVMCHPAQYAEIQKDKARRHAEAVADAMGQYKQKFEDTWGARTQGRAQVNLSMEVRS